MALHPEPNPAQDPTVAPSSLEAATDAGQRIAQQSIGDWLLTFGDSAARLPMRQASLPWSAVVQAGGWTLWQTGTGDGWRGLPLTEVNTGPWQAWLAGELYGVQSSTDAIIDVLEGRNAVEKLNGHFLLLAWNCESGEWHVWTNRHATLHAYLAVGANLAVGTFMSAVAVAAGKNELDWAGLTTFFGFGFFAGDRTHLSDVRILRPATHYRFDATGQLLETARYWQWWHSPDPTRSYDETVDEFAERFGVVMDDLTSSGRIAIPISGGLDSRTTVAPLGAGARDRHLWSYSYGYSDDSIETFIARQVAGARNLGFDAFTIAPYLFPQLSNINAAVEGFEDVTQCRQAAVVREIDDVADYLIAAHLGDLFLDDMGLIGAGSVSASDLTAVALKKVRKGGSAWLMENVIGSHLVGSMPEEVLHESVSAELARLAGIAEPDFRIKAFKVDQWCARWTTVALRMYQAAAFPRLPFYDTRLTDFFGTVPAEMLRGRRLQIDYLRRYAPDLAGITWQVTGRDLYHDGRSGLTDFASRAVSRGLRTLRQRQLVERNWEVQFAGREGQQGLSKWLLEPGITLHNYVDPNSIGKLLADFRRDPYGDKRSYTVAMLLSLSVWLETHFSTSAVAHE